MVRVVGIDHLVVRVSDYEKSKAFYSRLFTFLGFEVSEESDDAIAVFFLDPDGLKLEGMKYGEEHARATRSAARKSAKRRKRRRHA